MYISRKKLGLVSLVIPLTCLWGSVVYTHFYVYSVPLLGELNRIGRDGAVLFYVSSFYFFIALVLQCIYANKTAHVNDESLAADALSPVIHIFFSLTHVLIALGLLGYAVFISGYIDTPAW